MGEWLEDASTTNHAYADNRRDREKRGVDRYVDTVDQCSQNAIQFPIFQITAHFRLNSLFIVMAYEEDMEISRFFPVLSTLFDPFGRNVKTTFR
ncbi:hypothetical protein KIN20_003757 [Parelaphostrongylus tenuis]|uniref:Uncharacterized protein n=1 Tax=Parelaphostrongylus tenuis TaxID=148309 RepID=A0AAD5MG36_PARTN|nr:hypothetical protein KIN20_003757 [Parelaphostrongylus tenuis]